MTAAVIMMICFGLNDAEKEMNEQEVIRLEESITRAAVSCYSIEGQYPADLNYLRKNYGIIIDETKFNVFYQGQGSNLMPEIKVYRKG